MDIHLSAANVAVLGMAFSFLLVVLLFVDRRYQMRLWRDTLVYMKSKTAYEAEDAIDREQGRDKTIISKVLAERKKKAQNLTEMDDGADMAAKIKEEASKAYDEGI